MSNADVIVVGLGAVGAATLYQLATRDVRVIGIDRYSPPHVRGSTHGDTRITRQAIGEGEQYTPIVLRSHAIWRDIEAATGADLLTQCGGLIIESPRADEAFHHRKDFLARTVACAERYGIEHETLAASAMASRFPQFTLDGDETAYYEPGAGFVRPERCVGTQLELARRHGAEVLVDERVLSIDAGGGRVAVHTERGVHAAAQVVLAAGPWVADLISSDLQRRFAVYRQVMVWYELRDGAVDHSAGAMPVFVWSTAGEGAFYGLPAVDGVAGGVKVATEQLDEPTTADAAPRDVGESETRVLHARIAPRLRGVSGRVVKAARCLYTVTLDMDFVIDRVPEMPAVLLVSPCSGHGFKHSAGLGEAIAELVVTGRSELDLSSFRLDRPSLSRASGS